MRNGFCFLTDNLPTSLGNKGHAIELDTRTSSAVAVLLYLNGNHNPYEKSAYAVARLCKPKEGYPVLSTRDACETLECDEAHLAELILTYLAGAPRPKAQQTQKNGSKTDSFVKTSKLPLFDFVQDSDAIISAMRQIYGLSIQQIKDMHYWEFCALFYTLPEGTYFGSLKQIRSMKIDPKASPERKAEIREAKRAFALIDTRTPEQKKADLQHQIDALEL